jgi:tRNA threonylcarbamoyladenosine biosynthesis protein TsaE
MVEVRTPEEMFDLGKRIGAQLQRGDLILLHGALGAGKTLLTQGMGSSLGFDDITSPTFVISKVHKGKIPLIHVDAYRLLQSENPNLSLDDLDLDTEREDAITVVEWGGSEAARLSDERLELTINRTQETRRVTAVGFGERWKEFSL